MTQPRSHTPSLLPWPRQLRLLGGVWTPELDLDARVSGEAKTLGAARILGEEWKERAGGNTEIRVESSLPAYTLLLGNEPPEPLTPPGRAEGYGLRIASSGAAIRGHDAAGLLHAVHSLIQCAGAQPDPRFPSLAATDWPEMSRRMVMYDIARGQHFRLDYMKTFVRRISKMKINTLMLYLEARFAFRKHTFWPEGSMTHEEARELDRFAADQGVEIIPQVNCFGHMEHVLVGPYARFRDDPARAYALDPTHPDALGFLGDLFDEIADAFRSPLFHAGFDEVPSPGKNPRSKAMMDRIGYEGLYSLHVRNVRDMLADRGKRTMIWGDMLLRYPETIRAIPRDIVIFHWNYAEAPLEHAAAGTFTDLGFETVVCPIVGNWHDVYTHSSIGNINSMLGSGQMAGASGACGCIWELRDRRTPEMHSYSIGYFAERSWRPEAPRIDDFRRRFADVFFGVDDPTLSALYEQSAVPDTMPARCTLTHWLRQDKTRPPGQRRRPETAVELPDGLADVLLQRARSMHAEITRHLEGVVRNRDILEWYRRQTEVQAHVALWLKAWMSLESAARNPDAEGSVARGLLADWEAFAETFTSVVRTMREAYDRFGTDPAAAERLEANRQRVDERLAALREIANGTRSVSELAAMANPRETD